MNFQTVRATSNAPVRLAVIVQVLALVHGQGKSCPAIADCGYEPRATITLRFTEWRFPANAVNTACEHAQLSSSPFEFGAAIRASDLLCDFLPPVVAHRMRSSCRCPNLAWAISQSTPVARWRLELHEMPRPRRTGRGAVEMPRLPYRNPRSSRSKSRYARSLGRKDGIE